jgi:hypothetical protein
MEGDGVKIETKKSQLFEGPRTQRDRHLHPGFYKAIIINVIVICGLLVSLEYSYRLWLYFRNCDRDICHNTAFLTKLDAFNRNTVYTWKRPDSITGYSLVDNGTFVINEPGWNNNATITIRQGVRVNPNFKPTATDGAILAVGHSFVFGDQVSDDETWPALLERRLDRRVINGGVSGFGPVEAVLRAEQLLKVQTYSLVILSIKVPDEFDRRIGYDRNRVAKLGNTYLPAVIREGGKLRLTTVEENHRFVSDNFICAHPWIAELFFWSHIAKRYFSRLDYDGLCQTSIYHPKAATEHEILQFTVERFATLPVNKAILIQYPRTSFESTVEADKAIDEAQSIRNAANRHGVPVIDTYDALKNKPLHETYIYSSWYPHHSRRGNEVVADLIASEIRNAPVPAAITAKGAPGLWQQPPVNQ